MSGWWSRLLRYARPERRTLWWLLALLLAGTLLEALLPWPLKGILDQVLGGQPLPAWLAWLPTLVGGADPARLLGAMVLALVGLFVAAKLVQLARATLEAAVSARMQYALARDVFDHLQGLSLGWHARQSRGDLVRRVAEDTGCVPRLVTGVALPLVNALLMLLVLFLIMWRMDPTLALIAVAVALPMGLLMRLLGPRMSERAFVEQQTQGELWALSEHTLTALPLVQGFGREQQEGLRFHGVAGRSVRAYLRSIAAQIHFKLGVDGLVALGTAAVFVLGGLRVLQGGASLGTLVVFISYLTTLYAPLVTLAYLSPTIAAAAGSARRVKELLDTDERVQEAPNARPLSELVPGGRVLGAVTCEQVDFGYVPGRPVLHGIDLVVAPGETIAVVGPTGAGKSSLIGLLARLFDPWTGRVLIDGVDLRAATLTSVRAQFSLVHQEPFLLPLSIAENIAYGRPDANQTDIVAAARAAGADEFIRRLPAGYDTLVGERGATLSGGQRQRLTIARAILKDAPILILDEPTAALDVATEADVLAAIESLTRGRTTFIIAHRLSSIRSADRILVLEAGRVVDIGPHAELLARCPLYQRLHAAAG